MAKSLIDKDESPGQRHLGWVGSQVKSLDP